MKSKKQSKRRTSSPSQKFSKADVDKHPKHPGEILEREFLTPLKLTQREVAEHLNVEVKTINRLVNKRTRVSTLMALKLAAAFKTSPEHWLQLQAAYDSWHLKKRLKYSPPASLIA
jgi:addiction module HigA family antidote